MLALDLEGPKRYRVGEVTLHDGSRWMTDMSGHTVTFGHLGLRVPDLSDPCTLGGLLYLVREAWGSAGVDIRLMKRGWEVRAGNGKCWHDGNTPTFLHALVAALEAAPTKDTP